METLEVPYWAQLPVVSVRGFAGGLLPQDLGFSNAYSNNGFANIGIGIARDGIRGGIVGGRDGILPGIYIGQFNNAVGYLVGFATTGAAPRFDRGAFVYEGKFFNEKGAITFSNVISGERGFSSTPDLSSLYAHERDHIFNPVESGLGSLYTLAHGLDLAAGSAGSPRLWV